MPIIPNTSLDSQFWHQNRAFKTISHQYPCKNSFEIDILSWSDPGSPHQLASHLTLAASYISLNRMKEAYTAVKEVLRINPNFSVEYFANMLPFKNQETTDKFVEPLRKAGLPE